MKWVYSIRRKVTTALLLAAIFVLLFVKNLIDSKNVIELGSTFSSVYEDRLLVEGYIYRMSDHLFRKKIMMDSATTPMIARKVKPAIDRYNETILSTIESYEKTKLTTSEETYFSSFKQNVNDLIELETAYLKNTEAGNEDEGAKAVIDATFNKAAANLDRLSAIQISEGKALTENSQKIVAGSSILTKFEIGILVAIGLMIVALVFESTTVFSRTPQNQSLN